MGHERIKSFSAENSPNIKVGKRKELSAKKKGMAREMGGGGIYSMKKVRGRKNALVQRKKATRKREFSTGHEPGVEKWAYPTAACGLAKKCHVEGD